MFILKRSKKYIRHVTWIIYSYLDYYILGPLVRHFFSHVFKVLQVAILAFVAVLQGDGWQLDNLGRRGKTPCHLSISIPIWCLQHICFIKIIPGADFTLIHIIFLRLFFECGNIKQGLYLHVIIECHKLNWIIGFQ